MTADYAITMKDSAGRTAVLNINGASIDELVREGYSEGEAVEAVEGNAFGNAIDAGRIDADAWMESRN